MRKTLEAAAISARKFRGDVAITSREATEISNYVRDKLEEDIDKSGKESVRPELLTIARQVLENTADTMSTDQAYQEVVYHHILEDDVDPKVVAAAAQWNIRTANTEPQQPMVYLTPEEKDFVMSLVDGGFSIEQAFTIVDGWRGDKPSMTVDVDERTGVVHKKYMKKV